MKKLWIAIPRIPNACTAKSPGENAISGFDFLKKRDMIQLVMTSLSDVYAHPDGYNVTCINAITTDVDESAHTVTQTVYYKEDSTTDWEIFSQTFKFQDSESQARYDRMENTELSGAPSGTYTFEYNTLGCAVVTIEKFGERMRDNGDSDASDKRDASDHADTKAETPNAAVEGDTELNEHRKKPNCMMWAVPRHVRGLQICCEQHFSEHCEKDAGYEYTPEKCPVPTAADERSDL
ncbi:hypothetical protein MRX96_046566 [Rhipicephalus microplus]